MEEQLNAIAKALIYLIESQPNYERYSDYGTPEAAARVFELENTMQEVDEDND